MPHKALWAMPFSSSGGVHTHAIQESRRTIRLEIHDQSGEQTDLKLVFDDVQAYKCTYLPALEAEMSDFYDKLVACPASRLGVTSKRHNCYVICFDDGPCYEIVASSFEA